MHEASAAEAIVKTAEQAARERTSSGAAAPRVTKIKVVLGMTRGFMEESLRFYVGFFAKGGAAEGAALECEFVKPRLRCARCGTEFERRRFSFDCPSCGCPGEPTPIGSEFYIDFIEVDEAV